MGPTLKRAQAPAQRPAAAAIPAAATRSTPGTPLRRRIGVLAGSLAAYTVLAVLFVGGAWHDLTGSVPIGGADADQSMWFLGWLPHALAHGLNPLVTTATNFPDGINVMWNTSQPLAGLVMAPITETLGVVAAYTVLLTLAIALSAWLGFIALRRWVDSTGAAWIGGLIFGFSPYMLAQALGHANLSNGITVPVLAMLVDDILVRRRRRAWVNGLMLGALVTAQLLLSEEILILEFLGATAVCVVVAAFHRDAIVGAWRYVGGALATAGAVAVGLCAWPLLIQLAGPQRLLAHPHGTDAFVSDPLGFIVPTSTMAVAPTFATDLSSHFAGNATEWNAYLGFPLIALVLWTVWRMRHDALIRVAAVTCVALAVLSLGHHLHLRGHVLPIPLPWLVIEKIPLIGNALPNRLMLVVDFGVALIAARGLALLWAGRARNRGIAVAAAVAITTTLAPAGAMHATATATPPFFTDGTAAQRLQGKTVLLAPVAWENAPASMRWQAESHDTFSTIGGYVLSPDPGATGIDRLNVWLRIVGGSDIAAPLTVSNIRAYRAALASAGVTTFVLGPSDHQARLEHVLTAIAGSGPESVDGVQIWSVVATT